MFSNFLTPQIEYLLILQNFREMTNGFFDNFFMLITQFGEITIPVVIIAGIYWSLNNKIGMFVLWNWGLGMYICEFIKSATCIYRPWILDSRIQPIEKVLNMSGGYSFPSGHTQTAVSIWGGIALCFKKRFLTFLMIILIILIGFSRNYLGVHTPQDVIVSVFVSIILFFAVNKIMNWCEQNKKRNVIIFSTVILFSILLVIYEHFKIYPLDYVDGKLLVDPVKMRLYAFPKIGLLLGIFTGWFLNEKYLNFDAKIGTINEKIIRFILGTIILSFLSKYCMSLLSAITDRKIAMFCTGFISPFFITYIWPLLIIKFQKKSIISSKSNN